MTENPDTSDKSKNRDSSKDASAETANHTQSENQSKECQQCRLQVRLDKKGNVKVESMDESCLGLLEELPPVRRQFWIRRLPPELRGKTEHAEEAGKSKGGSADGLTSRTVKA